MTDNLPPGVSLSDFESAIGELRELLPLDSIVIDNPAEVRSYRDPWRVTPEEVLPSAAVLPRNVEEIQDVLGVARKYRIPLWTISTGKNYAYGGPAPRKAGYIVLDLKRMNRILEVNEKYGYAVVEPGVSYFDLYNYLQRTGSKLWIDPAAPGWGGVMGNALERGAGYTPYGDHFVFQCGMQVVLADGSVVETGMGALPQSNTSALHKYGCGPSVDGLFTASNAGIVTKMGIWLMPEPPGFKAFKISFPNETDLVPIMEVLRPLKLNLVIPNGTPVVGPIYELGHVATRAQYQDGKGPISEDALRKLVSDYDVGMWNVYSAFYGPPPIIENNWKVVEEAFRSIPGGKIYLEGDRPHDEAFKYRIELMRGIPNMAEYGVVNWAGGAGHLDFVPVSPINGEEALRQFYAMKERLGEYKLDYCGEFMAAWRFMAHVNLILFDVFDLDEKARVNECYNHLIDDAVELGYSEYRTHPDYMDKIANTYSWNDHSLLKTHEKIKDAIDPRGILAPGKSGVWPKHLRAG